MQTFLTTPKYNKFYIYKTPTSQYQRFCNAFGYYRMVNTKNPMYPKVGLCIECSNAWKEIRHKSQEEIKNKIREYLATKITIQVSQRPIEEIIVVDTTPPNAAAQKKAAEAISATNTKLAELQRIYNSTTDL
ncbi:hypothetical protein RhiirA4_474525 [Rhizophagus irregularis]|uniref:Uncharacterized protein n=1 Tax=Rhizophagus irregularis TaxID=588596 RepID=A0A2I1H8K0_9GLOM|nr:hypothetical protein RhiirA4_474525 [Rhizophagus irregularis]